MKGGKKHMGRFFESESQLIDFAKQAIEERRHGAKAIGLFGSRARGTQRNHSDMDMLVLNDKFPLQLPTWTEANNHPSPNIRMVGDIHILKIPKEIFKNKSDSRLNHVALNSIKRDVIWIWKKGKHKPR
jgi:predicted nucleotidyltransferase